MADLGTMLSDMNRILPHSRAFLPLGVTQTKCFSRFFPVLGNVIKLDKFLLELRLRKYVRLQIYY